MNRTNVTTYLGKKEGAASIQEQLSAWNKKVDADLPWANQLRYYLETQKAARRVTPGKLPVEPHAAYRADKEVERRFRRLGIQINQATSDLSNRLQAQKLRASIAEGRPGSGYSSLKVKSGRRTMKERVERTAELQRYKAQLLQKASSESTRMTVLEVQEVEPVQGLRSRAFQKKSVSLLIPPSAPSSFSGPLSTIPEESRG